MKAAIDRLVENFSKALMPAQVQWFSAANVTGGKLLVSNADATASGPYPKLIEFIEKP